MECLIGWLVVVCFLGLEILVDSFFKCLVISHPDPDLICAMSLFRNFRILFACMICGLKIKIRTHTHARTHNKHAVGMNLGKVEICGAECHVWDVGGKMHDLWSRYYDDCDAVIFVWKIVDDGLPVPAKQDAEDYDDDQLPHVSAAQQIALLEQVREAIPDDVPFMIWGHWFPSTDPNDNTKRPKAYQYNQPYETGSLVPHYHNPLMVAYFGSAKTGHGVRSSIEWLIPLAVRQKKFRDKLTKG